MGEEVLRDTGVRQGAPVVVLHLVVVPHGDRRYARMHRLQVRIGFEQGVAQAVLLERLDLHLVRGAYRRALPPQVGLSDAVLVDVIADEHHQIEVLLLGEVAVGGEVAVVPGLAGDQAEGEGLGLRAGGRQGAEAADGTLLPAHRELVVVVGPGLQALHARGGRRGRAAAERGPGHGPRCRAAPGHGPRASARAHR